MEHFMKRIMKHFKKTNFLFLLLLAAIFFSGCKDGNPSSGVPSSGADAISTDSSSLEVHFLDVGQGNSIFLRNGSHTMLIDGGDRNASSFVVSYLEEQGIDALDYVITTHYDSDHLNGILGVLSHFEADKVLDPDYEADTRLFQSYLALKEEKDITSIHPAVGETYSFGDAIFTILAPGSTSHSNENNYSIGILLDFGSTSFLFAGDAQLESEYEMLASGIDLSADVYLVNHHGSSTSTSETFLEEVSPSYAVISVGADNDYGHPHKETVEKLGSLSIPVYRTDLNGTVIASSDGKKIAFSVSRETSPAEMDSTQPASDESASYIGNKNTKKFHLPDCSGLPSEKNRVYFSTREEAMEDDHSPCGLCNP